MTRISSNARNMSKRGNEETTEIGIDVAGGWVRHWDFLCVSRNGRDPRVDR